MFRDAKSFNINLSDWNVAKVERVCRMFGYATSFAQELCWDVSKKGGTTRMFIDTSGYIVPSYCPECAKYLLCKTN